MRGKYKVTLLVIAICIFLLVGVQINYQMYLDNQVNLSAFIKVTEGLSINYLNGTTIEVNNSSKEISFSVTNQLATTLYYDVDITNLSSSVNNATYRLTSDNANLGEAIGQIEVKPLSSRIAILPGETHRYTLEIVNPDRENFSLEIEVKSLQTDNSFANTILNQNEIKESALTTFDLPATENEGLIKMNTELGSIYYFRGNVTNNYVSFAGLTWRILRINEDNTVKLVLDSTTPNLIAMNTNENFGSSDFLTSNIYQNLNEWYASYLQESDSNIVSTYYCYDNSLQTTSLGNIEYLSNIRLFTNYAPTTICSGTNVSSKIALLTADEVAMAGGSSTGNTNYYLYIPDLQASWWTMTPNANNNGIISYMVVDKDGALIRDVAESSQLFVRPTITLTRRVTVSGQGTIEDPYVLN